ncbi:MAG: helix-turn-helix transcriptional regulator [Oscillospiraceae bacterium]|nr:helix-turn-helix transcriptional regulator [Oscillospiraceae bacterium]
MKIDAIGHHHHHDRTFYIDKPEGAGDWLLLLILSPAVFRLTDGDVRVSAGSFILFAPHDPQYYYGTENVYCDDWMHFWAFDEDIALMESLGIPFHTPVEAENIQLLSSILEFMMYEYNSKNEMREQTVNAAFRMLLFKMREAVSGEYDLNKAVQFLRSQSASNLSADRYVRLCNIRETIYRMPGKDWSVADMAAVLQVSSSYFQHLYTRAFGISVNQDLIRARLELAAKLLSTTAQSAREIGVLLGYRSYSYFCNQFKGAYGMTPEQYRAKLR